MLVPLEHAASTAKQGRRINRFIGATPSSLQTRAEDTPEGLKFT